MHRTPPLSPCVFRDGVPGEYINFMNEKLRKQVRCLDRMCVLIERKRRLCCGMRDTLPLVGGRRMNGRQKRRYKHWGRLVRML